jgi:hypothetical protein
MPIEYIRRTAVTAFLLSMLNTVSVAAPSRCKVMDPTGTPLNVRAAPLGSVIGNLPNGMLVSVADRSVDQGGKLWVYISRYSDGESLGWVFREFISCF